MAVERVDAAAPDQPHEMQRATALADRGARRAQRRIARQGSVGDCGVDTNEILRHDATRAQIEMSHFTVAHLAVGESHAQTRCGKQCARLVTPDGVPRRRRRQRDGVAFLLGPVSPAIQDDQHYRSRRGSGHFS